MRLQGKTLIVTGSSSGIGRAIARRATAEGARVLLHGLEREAGEALAAELGARYVYADLADPAAPAQLVQTALETFGKLDGLVNNAAWVVRGQIDAITPELFDRIMAINCRAPLLLIKEALPHLAATRGAVVNIGSVNAYAGEENLLPYSISKGALMTLTRNLGDTLLRQHGVRVNQLNPGWVLTENEIKAKQAEGMSGEWWRDLPPLFAPAGRILAPEEIAEGVIYFLSDACGPISGQVLDLEQYPSCGRNPPKC